MSEFTYLFRGRDASASPEQMQKTVERWVAWMKDLKAGGRPGAYAGAAGGGAPVVAARPPVTINSTIASSKGGD